jgi:hypothetical protein
MAATALSAVLVVGTATAGARSSRPDRRAAFVCPGPRQRLIAADADAVVYQTPAESQEYGEEYACAYAGKRAFLLGPPPYGSAAGSGGVGRIALAGPVVAYSVGRRGETQGHTLGEVWVRNLVTGKLLHRMPNGSPAEPGNVGLGLTIALVVKSDGSVAWINGAPEALGTVQVRSVDASGSHLLAVSPEIEPKSLALAGSTLYWTEAGKPYSALLQ